MPPRGLAVATSTGDSGDVTVTPAGVEWSGRARTTANKTSGRGCCVLHDDDMPEGESFFHRGDASGCHAERMWLVVAPVKLEQRTHASGRDNGGLSMVMARGSTERSRRTVRRIGSELTGA